MTPGTLNDIGRALFGQYYLTQLADVLDINEKTIRRWRDDEFNTPGWLDERLLGILKNHRDEINRLMALTLSPPANQ